MIHMQTTATYRKTKQGQWVAFGPADMITAGADVTVTKRSGQAKTEHIDSVGRIFRVDGRDMVYGYLGEAQQQAKPRGGNRYAGECDDCGAWVPAHDGHATYCDGDVTGCMRHFDGGWAVVCGDCWKR
jgi:hypothetical protein